jgi:F0F1-type ATP synthase membrane subunit a
MKVYNILVCAQSLIPLLSIFLCCENEILSLLTVFLFVLSLDFTRSPTGHRAANLAMASFILAIMTFSRLKIDCFSLYRLLKSSAMEEVARGLSICSSAVVFPFLGCLASLAIVEEFIEDARDQIEPFDGLGYLLVTDSP